MYTYALGFASPLATRGQWPSFTSLSLFPLRRRRQIDKDILAAKQALCTGRTNHHHMANVVARGVSSYMYCMYARDSDGHPLPLGRGGEWWWWVGRGLMTDEEPVQVANWHGSVQSIHRTSHLMAAMADYTAYFLPHVEKKGLFQQWAPLLALALPSSLCLSLIIIIIEEKRREESVSVRRPMHFPGSRRGPDLL